MERRKQEITNEVYRSTGAKAVRNASNPAQTGEELNISRTKIFNKPLPETYDQAVMMAEVDKYINEHDFVDPNCDQCSIGIPCDEHECKLLWSQWTQLDLDKAIRKLPRGRVNDRMGGNYDMYNCRLVNRVGAPRPGQPGGAPPTTPVGCRWAPRRGTQTNTIREPSWNNTNTYKNARVAREVLPHHHSPSKPIWVENGSLCVIACS